MSVSRTRSESIDHARKNATVLFVLLALIAGPPACRARTGKPAATKPGSPRPLKNATSSGPLLFHGYACGTIAPFTSRAIAGRRITPSPTRRNAGARPKASSKAAAPLPGSKGRWASAKFFRTRTERRRPSPSLRPKRWQARRVRRVAPDSSLSQFDWVPESPRGYVRDSAGALRCWRRPSGPIAARARCFCDRGAEHFGTSSSARFHADLWRP